MNEGDPYVYPGSSVLRNKLDIVDEVAFEFAERQLVIQRESEEIPAGDFDLDHLRAIHRHLFQDIYVWAGELRTVEIAKSGHQFQFRRFIETGMADVHRRLRELDFLRNLNRANFAESAGTIIGDVNYIHPFREGNGRTQLYYLKQLADRAGHPIKLNQIDPMRWIAASRAAHIGDYALMGEEISRSLSA